MTRLNSVIRPLPQAIIVLGVMFVVSSAAATVITLNTEPGSNGAETARFSRRRNIFALLQPIVRIERREAGHRQNLPGFGVHDDDAAGFAVVFLHCLLQFLLGRELNPLVNGELDIAARLRIGEVLPIEDGVPDIGLGTHDAGLALQHFVER